MLKSFSSTLPTVAGRSFLAPFIAGVKSVMIPELNDK